MRAGCDTRLVRCHLAVIAACVAGGCSPGEVRSEKAMDPTAARLLAVGAAYSRFNFSEGRPPRAPEDLRDLLPGADAFVSPRDSQPFVVFWGVDLRVAPTWARSRPILAHEGLGRDGCRYVLTTMRNVELLTEDEFRASSFPPQRPEPR